MVPPKERTACACVLDQPAYEISFTVSERMNLLAMVSSQLMLVES
jgi:hypothetical protein